ncbi:MAG: HlyD family secretion protein [Owenweeksia sp.]
MLNISLNSVNRYINRSSYSSLDHVEKKRSGKLILRFAYGTLAIIFISLFLPWTQNISSRGNITTLKPGQRPQTINSVIAGRIEKWFVQEGDMVKKGDTILFISEIKDAYFDPALLGRTEEQLRSKELSVQSYSEKVKALDNQIDALLQTSRLKLKQAENELRQAQLKVISDSMDFKAAETNYEIAQEQYKRAESLYEDGLKSLTDMENRELTMQKARASSIAAENRLLSSRNELINARMEITSLQAQYRNSISKAESDKFTALSSMYDAEAVVTKLQNQYMNYSVRSGFYYITAPQDGYVTKAIRSGIGETIKEGTQVVSIMPAQYDLAVEMYVRPVDLPLLEKGQSVRLQFDGWPAIVFSGWPNTSYGTYGGKVYAIDNFISGNGLYRVLVAPDPNDHPWPDALRIGSATRNMLLLKDVPIWYELWRQINGFPPDYYKTSAQKEKSAK